MGTPPLPVSLLWYHCLRALGIRHRGLYSTKDTFGVKPAWLEQQTGVNSVTLRKHYGRWMAGEVASELRQFESFDRTLFGDAAHKVLPRRARAVTGSRQPTDITEV
jgi:hypothetical protein